MAIEIIDYASLLDATADWLNRQDLTAQIPAFVTLTEAQFNRELRVRDMMVRAFTTSDAENVELPSDFLEVFSLVVAPGAPPPPGDWGNPTLRYMSERESNEVKQQAFGQPGPPQGYTIIGNMIELVPAPPGDVDLRLVYYARIPPLVTSSANWLLVKSPDLYLYSTLLQATPYLKDDDRLQTWSTVRGVLMESIRMESERSMRPTSGMVARAKAF